MKYTPAGKAITKLTVAVNKNWHKEGEPGADFFTVKCFGKTAEAAAQHLVKGQEVGVMGRIESRSYDGQDGVRRKVWEVAADHVDFGSKPRGQGQHQESGGDDDGEPFPGEDDPY